MAIPPLWFPQLPWVFEVICGQDWPAGDEDALRRCAQAWDDALKSIATLADDSDETALSTLSNVASMSADQFAAYWSQYTGTDISATALGQTAAQCQAMVPALYGQANEVEYTKLMIDVTLVLTYIQLIILIASAVASFGASLTAVPLLTLIARLSVQGLALRLLEMVAMMMLPDLIAQTWMLDVDHTATSWDGDKTKAAAENAAAGVVIGTLLGAGTGKLLGLAGEDFGRTLGGKAVTLGAHFIEGGATMDLAAVSAAWVNLGLAEQSGDKQQIQQAQQQWGQVTSGGSLLHQFASGAIMAAAFTAPHLGGHGTPLAFTGSDGTRYVVHLDDTTARQLTTDGALPDGFRAKAFDSSGKLAGTATFNGPDVSIDKPFSKPASADLTTGPGGQGGFQLTHDGQTQHWGYPPAGTGHGLAPDGTPAPDHPSGTPDGTATPDPRPKAQQLSYTVTSDKAVTVTTPGAGDGSMTGAKGSVLHYTPDGTLFRADLVDPADHNSIQTVQTADPSAPAFSVTGHQVLEYGPAGVGRALGLHGVTYYDASGNQVASVNALTGTMSFQGDGPARPGTQYMTAFGDHYDPLAASGTAQAHAAALAPFEPAAALAAGSQAPGASADPGQAHGQDAGGHAPPEASMPGLPLDVAAAGQNAALAAQQALRQHGIQHGGEARPAGGGGHDGPGAAAHGGPPIGGTLSPGGQHGVPEGLTPFDPPAGSRLEHLRGSLFRSEAGLVVYDGTDYRMLQAASHVHGDGVSFIVDIHALNGIPQAGRHGDMAPEQFVDLLQAGGWDGQQRVVLLGCDTGGRNSFATRVAAEIAARLKVLDPPEVIAADTKVWQSVHDGQVYLAAKTWSAEHGMLVPDQDQLGRWFSHKARPDGTVAVREVPPGEYGMPATGDPATRDATAPPPHDVSALAGGHSTHSPPPADLVSHDGDSGHPGGPGEGDPSLRPGSALHVVDESLNPMPDWRAQLREQIATYRDPYARGTLDLAGGKVILPDGTEQQVVWRVSWVPVVRGDVVILDHFSVYPAPVEMVDGHPEIGNDIQFVKESNLAADDHRAIRTMLVAELKAAGFDTGFLRFSRPEARGWVRARIFGEEEFPANYGKTISGWSDGPPPGGLVSRDASASQAPFYGQPETARSIPPPRIEEPPSIEVPKTISGTPAGAELAGSHQAYENMRASYEKQYTDRINEIDSAPLNTTSDDATLADIQDRSKARDNAAAAYKANVADLARERIEAETQLLSNAADESQAAHRSRESRYFQDEKNALPGRYAAQHDAISAALDRDLAVRRAREISRAYELAEHRLRQEVASATDPVQRAKLVRELPGKIANLDKDGGYYRLQRPQPKALADERNALGNAYHAATDRLFKDYEAKIGRLPQGSPEIIERTREFALDAAKVRTDLISQRLATLEADYKGSRLTQAEYDQKRQYLEQAWSDPPPTVRADPRQSLLTYLQDANWVYRVDQAVSEIREILRALPPERVAASGIFIYGDGTASALIDVRVAGGEPVGPQTHVLTFDGAPFQERQYRYGAPGERFIGSGPDRSADAEAKLLDEFRKGLPLPGGKDAAGLTGTLVIGSNKLICPSCQKLIGEIEGDYPGVMVVLATEREVPVYDQFQAAQHPATVWGTAPEAGKLEPVELGMANSAAPHVEDPPDLSQVPLADAVKLLHPPAADLSAAIDPRHNAAGFRNLAEVMKQRAAETGRMQYIIQDAANELHWVEGGTTSLMPLAEPGMVHYLGPGHVAEGAPGLAAEMERRAARTGQAQYLIKGTKGEIYWVEGGSGSLSPLDEPGMVHRLTPEQTATISPEMMGQMKPPLAEIDMGGHGPGEPAGRILVRATPTPIDIGNVDTARLSPREHADRTIIVPPEGDPVRLAVPGQPGVPPADDGPSPQEEPSSPAGSGTRHPVAAGPASGQPQPPPGHSPGSSPIAKALDPSPENRIFRGESTDPPAEHNRILSALNQAPAHWVSRGLESGRIDQALLTAAGTELTRAGGLGAEVAHGGFGSLHDVPGHPGLLVKVALSSDGQGNAQLLKEAANLDVLTKAGLPTVYRGLVHWQAADGQQRTGILMDRVEPGALSKALLSSGKFSGQVPSPADLMYVNDRTVAELQEARKLCMDHYLNIEDIQFMVAADGSVRFIDPARLHDLHDLSKVGMTQRQRREMMTQFENRMNRIIRGVQEIVRRRSP